MVDDMLAFLPEVKTKKSASGDGGNDLQSTLSLTRDNIKAIIMVRRCPFFFFFTTETSIRFR